MRPRMAGISMHGGFESVVYVLQMFLSILAIILRERVLTSPTARPQ